MQNMPAQNLAADNETAIKLLWAGLISYGIGFFTPQFNIEVIELFVYTWDILTNLGLAMILGPLALNYKAINTAKTFQGVKRFTVSGIVIMLLPLLVIGDFRNQINNEVGYEAVTPSIGYFALWIGIILTAIGTAKATAFPSYMFMQPGVIHPNYQNQAFQQQYQQPVYNNPQQNYYNQQSDHNATGVQPVQPPQYIQTNKAEIDLVDPLDQHPQSMPTGNQPQNKPIVPGNYCPNCGQNNDVGVKFCTACGNQF